MGKRSSPSAGVFLLGRVGRLPHCARAALPKRPMATLNVVCHVRGTAVNHRARPDKSRTQVGAYNSAMHHSNPAIRPGTRAADPRGDAASGAARERPAGRSRSSKRRSKPPKRRWPLVACVVLIALSALVFLRLVQGPNPLKV